MDDGYRIVNGLKLPPKKVVKIVRTTANGPKGTVLPEPKVWFFRSEEGEVVGPCAVNGCRGLITRETPIRKEGWPAWKKAYEVPEFAEILVHAKPPASEKWFWALVFSPMLMWILAMVLGENTEPLLCFLVALVSTLLFLHLDGRELKKSGRDDDSGSLLLTLIVGLIYIPIYLFSRGTRYTKKYIPPIIWSIICCVALAFVLDLNSEQNLQKEATGLLRQSLVKNFAKGGTEEGLSEYVRLTDVRDCVLVKEDKGRYSGLAQVEYTAKKVDAKGQRRRVIVQYHFKLLSDGENIMLQACAASGNEALKLIAFVSKLAGEE